MLWRVIEAEVVPTCRELGIGQLVWSPVAQGVLTGKYQLGQPLPHGSRATDPANGHFVQGLLTEPILTRIPLLAPLAAQAGLSLAQLAIAWVLQNDNVSAALIGATRPEQVVENVAAAGVELGSDLMAAIDAVIADVAYTDPALTVSPVPRP
jgi:aryl-alcohol dehydrogenase-like predicted oxidoreductase